MTPTESPAGKARLRSQYRAQRQAIDQALRHEYDQAIIRHLLSDPRCTAATRVGAYHAFDGEPQLMPLLQQLAAASMEIALPVVDHDQPTGLQFRRWRPQQALARSRMGIAEPVHGEPVQLVNLDLLLVPLVAWDRDGRRLGMGGGYYDRLLATMPPGAGPLRVGVAYSRQQSAQLPEEPWDMRLHAVVTEQGWVNCAD